jgi:hypothetical protein
LEVKTNFSVQEKFADTGQGFQSRHDFNGSETGSRFRIEPDLLRFGPRQGRPYFTYLPGKGVK